jgi:hypothetical protein
MRTDDGLDLNKYVVLERPNKEVDPKDVFVLRSSDIFAAATLYSYAAFLQTAVEFAMERDGVMTEEELDRLKMLAQHVQDRAVEWQRAGRHLPD